jgi:hypothetical protein
MNRLLEPDFDQRIADWLEEDPNHAPREVLGTVLAAYPSIPQRRAWRTPWRTPAMFNNRLVAAAAALVLVLSVAMVTFGLVALIGSPAPLPTPTASRSPSLPATSDAVALPQLDRRYSSRIYPLAFNYPGGWALTPASVAAASIDNAGFGAYDVVRSEQARFIVTSARLAPGESLDTFRSVPLDPSEPIARQRECIPPISEQVAVPIMVADDRRGDVAYVIYRYCGALGPYPSWWRAIAVRGGMVFAFQLDADLYRAEGDALFETFLRGVEIEVPAAPTASGGAPTSAPTLAVPAGS